MKLLYVVHTHTHAHDYKYHPSTVTVTISWAQQPLWSNQILQWCAYYFPAICKSSSLFVELSLSLEIGSVASEIMLYNDENDDNVYDVDDSGGETLHIYIYALMQFCRFCIFEKDKEQI